MSVNILRPVPILCSGDLSCRVAQKKTKEGRKEGKKEDDAYLWRLMSGQCMHEVLWKRLDVSGLFQTSVELFACSVLGKEFYKV